MKKGLILEGGAMRGMFTAGVLDVWMENGIRFDGMVGVSAGAAFGCNFKSNQPGRAIRYNKTYCRDPRYSGMRSLLRTGDIYGADFCYGEIPNRLDPFDAEAFRASPMAFYAVATDARTGKAVYHKCERGDAHDIAWMRASASMPLVSRLVEIDGGVYSDGGTADSIPLAFMEGQGYDRNVVVLTQPLGFLKQPNKKMPLIRLALHNHPALVRALDTRHLRYNAALLEIARQEAEGRLLVLRPPHALEVGAVEHDPARLETVYQLGRIEAERHLDELKHYLNPEA